VIASPSIARYPDYKTARFATIWEAVRPTLTIAPMPVCHNRPSRLEGFHPPPRFSRNGTWQSPVIPLFSPNPLGNYGWKLTYR